MSKKIKITPQFLEEVRKGVENAGSRFQYALQIDVAHTTVRDWLEGKTDHVRADVYSRVMNSESDKNEKWRIGQILRCIREYRSLTCPAIAKQYNISCPVIYDYENGRSFPRYENMVELFSALNIDPEVFLKYAAVPDKSPEELACAIIQESEAVCQKKDIIGRTEKQHIGRVLKCIRLMRGISGPEIQNKLGISTNSLYDYEKGRSFPKIEKASPLFDLYAIDRDIFHEFLCDDVSGAESFDIAREIIRRSEEKKTAAISNENVSAPAPAVPEDPEDRLLIDAVRQGVKNLTSEEKTILLRTIVLFTTQKTHKEFYKCEK